MPPMSRDAGHYRGQFVTILAAFCFAVSAFRLAGVVQTLRNLAARQAATLAGVVA